RPPRPSPTRLGQVVQPPPTTRRARRPPTDQPHLTSCEVLQLDLCGSACAGALVERCYDPAAAGSLWWPRRRRGSSATAPGRVGDPRRRGSRSADAAGGKRGLDRGCARLSPRDRRPIELPIVL